MSDNYINLCSFNFGKHSYSIIRNNDKIIYFEVDSGKYLMPIISFNLYDNEGKSLTSVNQHFFISQLVNRINLACKKGIFVSDNEIVDYLNSLKQKIEGDNELKKLFKGSLMKEIDEENFEKNKRDLLSYLDKYRFDTFVDYNNVSIFNGSLDKNDVSSDQNVETVDLGSTELVTESDNSSNDVNLNSDELAVDVNEFFKEPDSVQNDVQIENDNQVVQPAPDNQVVDVTPINSTDYFNNVEQVTDSQFVGDNTSISVSQSVQDNSFQQEIVDNSQTVVNDVSDNSVWDDNFKQEVVDTQPNVNDVFGVPVGNSVSDNNVQESSNSYLDQVKSRIESKNLNTSKNVNYDNEIGILDTPVDELNLDKTFISDKTVLPELESVADEVVDSKKKEKSNVGVIIFIIILVVLLILFTFYLYNYVF